MVLEGLAEAKKCLVAFFLFASGLLLPFLISVPAYAQQTPFPDCSTSVYLGQNIPTQLFRVNTATNPFTYPAIGAAYYGN